ncbi:ankyrin repeat domain-containing protein SOWAHA [Heptranchias perlo]|uniref:ankyrin repeat domain-containing protein SOWAHA n=1 Tax=Heptranchias perlo TaxID=212740 RepID=UPI00355A5A6D
MESILTQEVVIKFLVEAGGKVKNSDLLYNFRNELAQNDPQRKREARELFKGFINKVAVVREEEGVKVVVLKKKMQHLITAQQAVSPAVRQEKEEIKVTKALGKVESLGNLVEAGETLGGFLETGVRRNSAPSALTQSEVRFQTSGPSNHLENKNNADTEGVVPSAKQGWENLTEFQNMYRTNSDSLEQIMEKQCLKYENLPLEEQDPAGEGLSNDSVSASACPILSEEVKSLTVTHKDNVVLTTDVVPETEHLASPSPPPPPPPPTESNHSTLSFEQKIGNYESKSNGVLTQGVPKTSSTQKPKPYMYPLRLPPDSNRYDVCHIHQADKEKDLEDVIQIKNMCPLVSGDQGAPKIPKMKRSQPTERGCSSPYLKRASRLLKMPDDARFSDQVPLDPVEHEWIVKTAVGHWAHVLGLLLKDSYLAEKKDFMSGFTAVHWAAKSGNSEIMCQIINTAEKNGIKMDVNSKAYGGYTPLHIAAIHGKENVIVELVQNYGAKITLRDYSGKRPYHYLNKDNSFKVRQLLGDPESLISEYVPHKRGSKVASSILSSTNTLLGAFADDVNFQDFSKSLKKPTNLSKFFTAPSGHKKRAKVRMNFASLNEELEEEREENVLKRRPVTEIFF